MKVWRINEHGEIVWVEQKVPSNPKVGIFWMVKERDIEQPVVDAVPYRQGSIKDGFSRYGNHQKFWKHLEPKNDGDQLLKGKRFNHYPRGHVVYSTDEDQFIIFADPCMTGEDLDVVMELFDFGDARFGVKLDGGYFCHRCNPQKMRRENR